MEKFVRLVDLIPKAFGVIECDESQHRGQVKIFGFDIISGGNTVSTQVFNASPSYFPMGDQAVVIQFENVVSVDVSRRVQSFVDLIGKTRISGVTQIIPSFNNLTVCYNPIIVEYHKLVDKLQRLEENIYETVNFNNKTVHIPVVFGGKYGPDLKYVSDQTGISQKEVVQSLHLKSYFVYMVGWIAGFPYCGDLDDRLALPRRSSPRIKVKKGTITIANRQTGILPATAPTGWHLIGWTPMEIFNPYEERPSIFGVGDNIQYIPIDADEAERWDEQRQRKWDQEWNTLTQSKCPVEGTERKYRKKARIYSK